MTNNNIQDRRFLFFQTEESFLAALPNIDRKSIVFIKDMPAIWSHDTYFDGGGGGSGRPVKLKYGYMYYCTFTDKSSNIPDISACTEVQQLDSGAKLNIALQNNYVYVLVPNNEHYTLTSVMTSRYEQLDPNVDLDHTTIEGYNVWKYAPDVAPENLTLTFTFSIS